MEQKLSEQELVRRQKMEDLRAKGIDPFGHAFARTHRYAQPVSYTHLDVYKRQPVSWCVKLWLRWKSR